MSNLSDMAHQNAHRAATFFNRPGLTRLVEQLYEKYVEESQVRGQIILQDCSADERREIASFLGKLLYDESTIRVRPTDVEKALLHSFNCTLPDMLRASFPDRALVTRAEQQAQHSQRRFRRLPVCTVAHVAHQLPVVFKYLLRLSLRLLRDSKLPGFFLRHTPPLFLKILQKSNVLASRSLYAC